MPNFAESTRPDSAPDFPPSSLLGRSLGFGYAVAGYVGFFAVFGLFVLRNMGYAETWGLALGPRFEAPASALAFNFVLVLLFGVQHSVMAREPFKARLTRVVPRALERATFVWASNITLAAVSLFWSPIPGTIWVVTQPVLDWVLWVVGLLGWAGVAASSFLIDHFELFGLRQAWSGWRARPMPDAAFATPNAYRVIRHPMMLGMLVGLWFTPTMDTVRLVLAISMSVYVLAGVKLEERDMVRVFGDRYTEYQRAVPRFLPRLFARRAHGISLATPEAPGDAAVLPAHRSDSVAPSGGRRLGG
jgi:protein-S-isoprenylcysteine O-methyltransferase Ste14